MKLDVIERQGHTVRSLRDSRPVLLLCRFVRLTFIALPIVIILKSVLFGSSVSLLDLVAEELVSLVLVPLAELAFPTLSCRILSIFPSVDVGVLVYKSDINVVLETMASLATP